MVVGSPAELVQALVRDWTMAVEQACPVLLEEIPHRDLQCPPVHLEPYTVDWAPRRELEEALAPVPPGYQLSAPSRRKGVLATAQALRGFNGDLASQHLVLILAGLEQVGRNLARIWSRPAIEWARERSRAINTIRDDLPVWHHRCTALLPADLSVVLRQPEEPEDSPKLTPVHWLAAEAALSFTTADLVYHHYKRSLFSESR